jgi:DNA-binding response OmpR family regulator
VDTAPDGSEALAMMEREKPDLVILDVMMDWVLEGVSISQEMMSRRELQGIPIIMVTSIRSSEYMGMFPQDQYLHVNSWLDKPCSPDQLLSEVANTLARHREHQEKSP